MREHRIRVFALAVVSSRRDGSARGAEAGAGRGAAKRRRHGGAAGRLQRQGPAGRLLGELVRPLQDVVSRARRDLPGIPAARPRGAGGQPRRGAPKRGCRSLRLIRIGCPCCSIRRGAAPLAFGVKGMPTSFLIDKTGTIRFTHMGYSGNVDVRYRQEIAQLLSER